MNDLGREALVIPRHVPALGLSSFVVGQKLLHRVHPHSLELLERLNRRPDELVAIATRLFENVPGDPVNSAADLRCVERVKRIARHHSAGS